MNINLIMRRKLVLIVTVFVLLFTLNSVTYANANQKQTPEQIITSVITIISSEVQVDSSGIKLNNTENVVNKLKSVDLTSFEKTAKSQGIVYEGGLTGKKLVEIFNVGINQINKDIKDKKLKVLDKGTIVESNDDGFYLQGGSTYDVTHWWGKTRYKSTSAAYTWAYQLNTAAAANAGAAVLAGAVFGGVGAIPNGLTSAYCWALANSVSYYNGLSDRGIIENITWALVYWGSTQ